MSEEAPAKQKRFRSPPYPSFDLGKAVERVTALEKLAKHHEVGAPVLSEAWGMKSADGQVWRSAAALIQYGLVTDSGTGKSRKFKISDTGRRIVLDPNPDSEKRQKALQTAALLPMIHSTLWERYGASEDVSDSVLKGYLTLDRLDEGETPYSDSAADEVISSYRKTLAFADLTSAGGMHSETEQDEGTSHSDVAEAPSAGASAAEKAGRTYKQSLVEVNIGDFVQWKSQGVLQFEHPKRVRWISDDKSHIAVEGSDTSIPLDQISIEPAPSGTNPPPTQKPPVDPILTNAKVPAGQRKAVFPVSDGDVTFIFPDGLTIDGIEELEAYLAVFLKKEKRLAAKG